MDQEEIAKLCASLSLQSKVGKLWSVQNTIKDSAIKKLDLCLVGKVLSSKNINREAFRAVIPRIWQTALDIEVVQDNIFLFYFCNQGDRYRIMARGPWSFDNCLMVLEKPSGVGNIAKLGFSRVIFWIQIPNASLLCMTKEMGEFLGQLIGELVDIDVGVTGECFGKYIHLKVAIDISKPLKKFLRIELVEGEESILLLRYERLPEYCFRCGIIGHSYQECHNKEKEGLSSVNMQFDYGPWFRASSPPEHTATFVEVEDSGRKTECNIEVFLSGDVSKSDGGPKGLSGLGKEVQRQVLPGLQKIVEEGLSMQVDSRNGAIIDTDILHEVPVSEVTGPISLTVGGKSDKFDEGFAGCNKVPVALNLGKKKGKWKRWAREGGQRDSEPEGSLQVDNKRLAIVDLIEPRGGRCFHYESAWAENDKFKRIVHNSWRSFVGGDAMGKVRTGLSNCARVYQQWNKNKKRASVELITAKTRELVDANKGGVNGNIDWQHVDKFERDLDVLLKDDENRLSKGEIELLCMVWWKFWYRRNQVLHNSPVSPAVEVHNWAVNFLTGFHKASEVVSSPSSQLVGVPSRQAPGANWFKINTDVALDVRNNYSSLGVVIRDCQGIHGPGGERVPLLDVGLRLDAAGYLSSSVASVVQPLDFSFTELLLSGVLALQLHYVRVTVDRHAAVNVALMSFPFDGFEEASSLTESCHMPASVQGGSLSSPPMTHADCSAPVWEGLQEQEVICSTTESGFIHVFQTFHFQMVLLCCKLAKQVGGYKLGGVVESTIAWPVYN
ncbi:hypothetical protein EZV62_008559 [Acer yangbiense]|uniref:CCHC-type domain-containing protein n=1 Tax=Acer yangbiense TaxID=1000413 RepID=A0A5C7IDX9_9ROSI|nr:hypothetical protein EZV62_008559 [Acer yangbiense]